MKYDELDDEIQEIFEWFYDKFKEGVSDSIENGYDREAMAEFLMKKADEQLEWAKWESEEEIEDTPELD